MITLEVDVHVQPGIDHAPAAGDLQQWAAAAFLATNPEQSSSLSIAIVSSDEIAQMNQQFRSKDQPTNVLSFPAPTALAVSSEHDQPCLGDVVACAEVIEAEAKTYGKAPEDHWAHMIVHGTLHLLGHDHLSAAEAREMEALESSVLETLGIENPW